MSTLYIDRQHTEISTQNGVLHIVTPDQPKGQRVPLKYLERLVMRADTQLSSKTLCALASHGVSTIAIGGRAGDQSAQIAGAAHNDARRRWQQVLTLSQATHCAAIARAIVSQKISRQRHTIAHIAQARPDLRKPMHDAQQRLAGIATTLATADTPTQPLVLAQIRGLEGAAAAMYFDAYFQAFAPALGATHRNRRPPRDPVNALLSLSYTLLYGQATTACLAAGLDPALGALHTLSHARAALACDLMEPYRPGIDLWVWRLFQSGPLRPEHFGHDGSGACLLGKAGRSHFYGEWEHIAKRQQRSLLRYARQLSRQLGQSENTGTWAHLIDHTPESIDTTAH